MQHVPRECGYFQQVSRDHILESSTFPNKYYLKNRKQKPVTFSATENGRFQEISTISFLVIDYIHTVNSFIRRAAKVRPLDPARYSRLVERILIKLWYGSLLRVLKFVYTLFFTVPTHALNYTLKH
jgi:hypothetical protein